jgi:hypothetical protein
MSILKEIFGTSDALQRCWNELYSFEIFPNLPYCAIVPPAFTNDNFNGLDFLSSAFASFAKQDFQIR